MPSLGPISTIFDAPSAPAVKVSAASFQLSLQEEHNAKTVAPSMIEIEAELDVSPAHPLAIAISDKKEAANTASDESTVEDDTEYQANVTEDEVLDNAARLWPKNGQRCSRFRAAVSRCLSLGFSKTGIARHIRLAAFAEPHNGGRLYEDKLYQRVYARINYISLNVKTAEPSPNAAADEVLDDTTRLWSKEGKQSSQFRAAICHCLSLGLSQTEIARHIRDAAYAGPQIQGDDKLYKRIYQKVNYISLHVWKKSEFNKESKMVNTSQVVEVLLDTMNNMKICHDKENKPTNKEEDYAMVLNKLNLKKECQKEAVPEVSPNENKVLETKQRILDMSHRQASARIDSPGKTISSEASAAGKRRVKMIIQHPEQAEEYIRMGLAVIQTLDHSK